MLVLTGVTLFDVLAPQFISRLGATAAARGQSQFKKDCR